MFELSKEQLSLQQRARELAQTKFAPTAAETDRTEEYPWQNVNALRDAGFMGMTIPKSAGGGGLSYLDTVIVIEEMAKACATMGRITVEANMGAISAIAKYGTEPPRVLRRLQHLRRWSYDQVKQVLTRGPRACRTHGAGAPSRLPFAVGSH